MDWIKERVDEQDDYWDGVYGFDLECGEIQHAALFKWIKIIYAIPAWIGWVFAVVIRAVILIVFSIIFFLISI